MPYRKYRTVYAMSCEAIDCSKFRVAISTRRRLTKKRFNIGSPLLPNYYRRGLQKAAGRAAGKIGYERDSYWVSSFNISVGTEM